MNPVAAPEFPGSLEWLNTDLPFTMRDLAGRIVLLDFWTFSCATCTRLAPDIKRLQERYPELVIIGVHSPLFETGRVTENIREAVVGSGIEHPLVLDDDLSLWRAFGIGSWPSFVLIDPDGNVVGKTTGEGLYRRLAPQIERIRQDFGQRGTLNPERMSPALLKEGAQEGMLYYPGKITTDFGGLRLFIADSNHHRIVVADPEGRIMDVIGDGKAGSADGTFEEAGFYMPQGLAYDDEADALYVADAGNHTIRRVSLSDRTVETAAGTGLEAPEPGEGGDGPSVALSLPWDLTLLGEHLYVAMAGFRQIWRMHLEGRRIEPYAGSGEEALIDGPLRKAAFARPSGIDTDGDALYVADREASAVRQIGRGMVTTLLGHSLEDYGDLDTIARMARIHHPGGIACADRLVYIADTFNHKIKWLDLSTGWVLSVVGGGDRGHRDGLSGDARLNEPNDLVCLRGLWYITDTGNHAIRVYEPGRHVVSTLPLWR